MVQLISSGINVFILFFAIGYIVAYFMIGKFQYATPGRLGNYTDENADGRCDRCNTPLSIAAMKGDLDDDGQITPADARIVLRAAVGLDKLTDSQKTIADINRDGMITPSDARSVLRCAVGLDTF